MANLRLAVLASGRGSNLQAILEACEEKQIKASIVVVLSDKKEAGALKIAEAAGIKASWVDPKSFSAKQLYEESLLQIINALQVDYIVLA
ncbi:MAG: phosphoribosylglycinamide formyltransferase, partial [Desulfocucumaceae bacterium]